MAQHDIELLVNFIIQNLESQFSKPLSNEYYYQSLTLAAIDAVFSAQARYSSVQALVHRYCQRFSLNTYRKPREFLPSPDRQEHISSLIQRIEQDGIQYFMQNIFCNKSQTSGRFKVAILLDLLKAIRDCDIETFQDIQLLLNDADKQNELLERFMEVRGVGEATSRYFLMLAGDDRMVKPDRMILRFIRNALDKTVRPSDAVFLIQAVSDYLSKSYPCMSPRRLDHLIWYWQRSQSISHNTDTSVCAANEVNTHQSRTPKANHESLTIPQKVQESMYRRYREGDLLSRAQIKKDVLNDHKNISSGSVMPSDYCCNKWNKDARSGIYHIFFYEKKDTYRLLPRIDITKPRERGVCQEVF